MESAVTGTVDDVVAGMTEHEKYLFDLQGFLIVEDILTLAQVEQLNDLLDAYDLWNQPTEGRFRARWSNDGSFITVGECHMWDKPFRDLIGQPQALRYLRELIGSDLRLDHAHALLNRKGSQTLQLHGGATPWSPAEFYHYQNGRMYNGMVVVSYALQDSTAGNGGFAAIPGSHKSNFELPEQLRTFEVTGPWVQRLDVKAGSAIIFTEALTHGTWPWTGEFERRSLLYKYCPGHMAYGDAMSREQRLAVGYPTPDDVRDAEWSDQVQRLLEPPYVWDRPLAFHSGRQD